MCSISPLLNFENWKSDANVSDNIVILKFGGSSIKNADRIRCVTDIIKTKLTKKIIVVLSAIGKTTDELLRFAHGKSDLSIVKENHSSIARELGIDVDLDILDTIDSESCENEIVALGEQLSVRILSKYLNKEGVPSEPVMAWDIGLKTRECGGRERVEIASSFQNIQEWAKKLEFTPVVTGYLAKGSQDEITTLGRGGSDYTATIIGAAIRASQIEIWTDVDGVLTADPRIVKHAKTIDKLSFMEAAELAFFGAKVLHPMTVVPAMTNGIPVRVLNTYSADKPG
eukprot:GHVL01042543.1.p2 GENE.GHVL01042543.1~~GHVL01042543.1.p2  ORF type:complete len:285 (+),score=48.84 GHVL01042543.1:3059-3913(+)